MCTVSSCAGDRTLVAGVIMKSHPEWFALVTEAISKMFQGFHGNAGIGLGTSPIPGVGLPA